MISSLAKWSKIFIVVSLLGFGSTLADIHLDEFASKQSGGQSDTCCTTCCPTHNLGPSVSLLDATPADKIDCELPIEITFYSEEFIVSVFHPPRFVA